MSLKLVTLAGIRSTGIATVINGVLKLVQLIVLARLLPSTDFGLMAMAMLYISFAAIITDMGIPSAVIQKQEMPETALSALFWIGCLVGAVIYLCSYLAAPLVAAHFDEIILAEVVRWAGFSFLAAPISQFYRSVLEKKFLFERIACIEMAGTFIGVGCSIFLALRGEGVLALVWGYLATSLSCAVAFVWQGRRHWSPRLSFNLEGARDSLKFCGYLVGQRAINYFSGNVDFLVVGLVFGASALGFYSLAYNLCNLPSSQMNNVFSRVFFPVFSRLQNDGEGLKHGFLRFQEYSAIVNMPLLVFLFVSAPVLVAAVFGEMWRPAVPLIQLLSVVGLMRSLSGTVGPLLLAKGKSDLGFRWSVLVVCIQAPAIWAGSLQGSPAGVAAAFGIIQVLIFVLNYRILVRTLLGSCLRSYLRTIVPAILLGLGMGVVMYVSDLSHGAGPLVTLGVQLALGGLCYVGLLWLYNRRFFSDVKALIG